MDDTIPKKKIGRPLKTWCDKHQCEKYVTTQGKWRKSRCPKCGTEDNKTKHRDELTALFVKNERLKATFGITLADFKLIKESQGGRCAICRCDASESLRGDLYVDHCHVTGRIRGLLCNKCNTGIGMLRDSVEVVSAALQYLTRNRDAS